MEVLQIVVDPEGNLMLDSQEMRRDFSVSINLGEKGTVLFTKLQCAKAHCLGTTFPPSIQLITEKNGDLSIVHHSKGGVDVRLSFERGLEAIYFDLASGTTIGKMSIT